MGGDPSRDARKTRGETAATFPSDAPPARALVRHGWPDGRLRAALVRGGATFARARAAATGRPSVARQCVGRGLADTLAHHARALRLHRRRRARHRRDRRRLHRPRRRARAQARAAASSSRYAARARALWPSRRRRRRRLIHAVLDRFALTPRFARDRLGRASRAPKPAPDIFLPRRRAPRRRARATASSSKTRSPGSRPRGRPACASSPSPRSIATRSRWPITPSPISSKRARSLPGLNARSVAAGTRSRLGCTSGDQTA